MRCIYSSFIACVIGCMFFLCACNHASLPNNTTTPEQDVDNKVDIGSGYTFKEPEDLSVFKSGELIYTVSNPRLINRESDIPAGSFVSDAYTILPKTKDDRAVFYPDFINDDGEFTSGVYLLLIDVSVYSDDAIAYTKNDLDFEGFPKSLYDDPFFFRADPIINLCSTSQYIEGVSQYYSMAFYSLMSQSEVHPMGFHIEPRETIIFTVGFLVDDARFGGRMDLANISLCHVIGSEKGPYIQLDLGEN